MQPLKTIILFYILVISLTASAKGGGKNCADEVRILIVDAYSSGSLLPDAFRNHVQDRAPNKGTKIYHVHNDQKPIPLMAPTFIPSNTTIIVNA